MRGKCGSIVVFLGGLPAQWGARDLKDLVRTEIRSAPAGGLRAGLGICECSILRITDLDTGRIERHGLVEIRPPLLALQLIDRLDGRLVDGHRISARRYRQRSPMGSQGPRPTGDGIHTPNDRWERRRPNLRFELAESEPGIFGRLSSPLQWPWSIRPNRPSSREPIGDHEG